VGSGYRYRYIEKLLCGSRSLENGLSLNNCCISGSAFSRGTDTGNKKLKSCYA
jgi:hypothetical protein